MAPPLYNHAIEKIREKEYPALQGKTYLDHGGATLYAKSLVETFSEDMITHVYGNPHSASEPSALAGTRVDSVREQTLRFFGADPEDFDIVFVANATAAMKLVADIFEDHSSPSYDAAGRKRAPRAKFWYGYHRDGHNSLVGMREAATGGHHCFESDREVEAWIGGRHPRLSSSGCMTGGCMRMFGRRTDQVRLFAYPGQSNMTGRRLPLSWPAQIRASQPNSANTFVLLDAAALATTAPLNNVFRNPATAPDFTCISFYKIFGFPDLGGLIVRKDPATMRILASRRYFGGGTVDMVTVLGDDAFHAKKTDLHSSIEDGTLPFHSIIALGIAIDTHTKLFGSMAQVGSHTAALVRGLYTGLASLRHSNGLPVVRVYNERTTVYGDARTQGATIAFNVQRPDGSVVAPSAVESAANVAYIYLRSGSLCNPGGAAAYLGWSGTGLRQLYDKGLRCGSPSDIHAGKPVGVVRASLGAMSILTDVEALVAFLHKQYVDCVTDSVPEAMSYGSSSRLDFDGSEKVSPASEDPAGWWLFRCCV